MALINVYQGAVTAGTTNGTQVSTGGTYTAPISFDLNASQNETAKATLAVRTNSGYVTSGTTIIQDAGDTNDRVKLSWTENGPYADSISTAAPITATNTLFYAKASSADTELPTLDRSVSLKISYQIAAAS